MGGAAKLANLSASCSGGGAVSACNDCATTRRHPHPTPPNRYAIRLRILPPSRGKGGWVTLPASVRAFAPRRYGRGGAGFPDGCRGQCWRAGGSRGRRGPDRARPCPPRGRSPRSEEHTSELQSLMRISYAVFCLKKKNNSHKTY